MKLKNIFNHYSKKIKKPLVTLMAVFMLFASPSIGNASIEREASVAALNSSTTYWKNYETSAVAKIWPCKEKGLCITVVDLDYKNSGAKKLYKNLKTYLDIDDLTVRDINNKETGIKEICGRSFKAKLERDNNGNWSKGDFFTNFSITAKNNGNLSISGRITIISVSKEFKKVNKPKETCMDRIKRSNNQLSQNISQRQVP